MGIISSAINFCCTLSKYLAVSAVVLREVYEKIVIAGWATRRMRANFTNCTLWRHEEQHRRTHRSRQRGR